MKVNTFNETVNRKSPVTEILRDGPFDLVSEFVDEPI